MSKLVLRAALGGALFVGAVALTSSVATAKDGDSASPVAMQPATVAAPAGNAGGNEIPSCSFAISKLPTEQIQNWLANPQEWLNANPAGGLQMSNFVRSLVGSDSRAVTVLVGLTKDPTTNAAQRAAIGAGLARSAQAAQTSDPSCGAFIQETVAQAGSPEAIEAFQAALSQVATAALGPAGPAGGGAGPTGGGALTGGGAAGNVGPSGGTSTVASSSGSYSVGGGSVSEGSTTRTVYASPI